MTKTLNNKNLKKVLFNNGATSLLRLNSFKQFYRFELDFYNNNIFTLLAKTDEKLYL